MRVLVQRVSEASVQVEGQTLGSIGPGFVVLVGISRDDTEREAEYLVGKTVNLRIFNDEDGKFNLSALDVGAELLVISQFTLYGDTRKGRRPSFIDAAPPEHAEPLFDRTVELFRATRLTVETGRFQANMNVAIHNDGPVTIMLDTSDRERPRRD